jgi:phosphoglycerate dehydrogenase-like enzyme
MVKARSCRYSGVAPPEGASPGWRAAFAAALVTLALTPSTSAHAAATAPPAATAAADASVLRDLGLQPGTEPVRARPGWRPPRSIVVAGEARDWIVELRTVAPGVRFVEYSAASPPEDLAAADVSIGACDAALLQRAGHLAWIQWLGAGVERCVQQPLLHERRPLLTNLQRAAAPSMAEHVLAMMLLLGRHLDYFLQQQQQGTWADGRDAPAPQDLAGRTLLVVGLGGIGTEVARRAHDLGMRVIATRASGRTGPTYVSYVGTPKELLQLAGEADYVVNCAPLTPQTTGLFDQRFFAAMKPTAFFLSVGRGRSTVTADLVAALQAHRIAGAGLDVTDPEPLPASSPLWRLPNVIITPHISGYTPLADQARRAIVRENLRRYLAGDALYAIVDIERGY